MAKKIIKIILLILAIAFIAIQFIRPDRTNPPENPGETLEASAQIPADVGAILSRSCADCHSNRTIYPWYSNVAPFSWFLDNHIREGRGELNISVWNTYDTRKKTRKLDAICDQIETGEMPLPSYLWIHWDAKLKEGESKTICDWTEAEKNRLQAE
jgi:Haem-binding domain